MPQPGQSIAIPKRRGKVIRDFPHVTQIPLMLIITTLPEIL